MRIRSGHGKLYEINTIVWLDELSRKHDERITLENLPEEEIDSLNQLGFDYIWLMGVWKRSAMGREIFIRGPEFQNFVRDFENALPGWRLEDVIGSPYSIAAYEPEPLIGTWRGLQRVRKMLNDRDMGLVLDFVPNHTAPDHKWVKTHPDYYIQGDEEDYRQNPSDFTPIELKGRTHYFARGRDPYFPPWSDTVQLNHFNPAMKKALLSELKKIARYADGIRCDMAMLVLKDIFHNTWGHLKAKNLYIPHEEEFWQMIHYSLPRLLLIAEAYWDTEWTLQQLGFHYVYDKRLYDRLRHATAYDVLMHLKADRGFQEKLLRFIENHDEDRSAVAFSQDRLKAAGVVFSTLPGLKLYHHGQFEGRKIRVPLQLRCVRDEPPDRELQEFYMGLLSIIRQEIYYNGRWQLVMVEGAGSENVIAYQWQNSREFVMVAVNFSSSDSSVYLIPQLQEDLDRYVLSNIFYKDAEEMLQDRPGAVSLSMKGYGYCIFYGRVVNI